MYSRDKVKVSISVQDKPIHVLIDEIESGSIVIPSFQRDFIWDSKLVRDLFDSIYRQFPIGVLILWHPSEEYFRSLEKGRDYVYFHDDIDAKVGISRPKALVLDGHQRLTSIILPLHDWRIKRLGRIVADFKDERLFFNLTNEEFLVGVDGRGIDLAEIYEAYYSKKIDVLKKLVERIREEDKPKLESLAKRIFEYRIPVYTYITEQEAPEAYVTIAEGFIRINKTGVKIGNVDLLASLILGHEPSLNRSISNAFSRVRENTGIDNKGLIIRLILKRIGLKQTDIARIPLKALKSLEDKIRSAMQTEEERTKLKKFIEEDSVDAFNEIQNIFRDFGITGTKAGDIIPSQISLLPISYYLINLKLHDTTLSNEDKNAIISWIILSSIRRYYVSNVDKKLESDLRKIDSIFGQGDTRFMTFLLNKIDELGSRGKISITEIEKTEVKRKTDPWVFALYILLVQRGADDWTGYKLGSQNFDNLSVHHIFPRRLKKRGISSLANITLINVSTNKSIGDKLPEQYLSSYIKALEAHLIPTDPDLWTERNFEDFIKIRGKAIYVEFKRMFPYIFE